ncbi:hypothetical protein EVAR_6759_1 [Eumeta japonica]|uniref:Uncharacterized protein n=1 Tax=Eumeta variegata TaxID=151549 RepID=A0A4C1V3R0_EUMVA|nr:hypothetical protein EVAR_6759_1 [Eumeta japonica]
MGPFIGIESKLKPQSRSGAKPRSESDGDEIKDEERNRDAQAGCAIGYPSVFLSVRDYDGLDLHVGPANNERRFLVRWLFLAPSQLI